MTVLALIFLGVYAVTVIATGFPDWLMRSAELLNTAIWLVFAVDLGIRLYLAEEKVAWAKSHPIDVVSVLLPALRPLRALRVFTAGQSLMSRRDGALRTGEAILYGALALVLIGALAELDAEKGAPDASIVTFGDSLWWAITTVTTVGYGDLYPVTPAGRFVAAALMIVGISVLGVVTASVAAWLVEAAERARETGKEVQAELEAEETKETGETEEPEEAAKAAEAAEAAESEPTEMPIVELGASASAESETAAGVEPSTATTTEADALAMLGALRRAGVLTEDEVAAAVGRLPG
ncbi:potassium channel family protein [Actinotalea sp. M2MS4P-6]|nr:potassium channel family protein [Actinotalea sp. M2MS4P-6]